VVVTFLARVALNETPLCVFLFLYPFGFFATLKEFSDSPDIFPLIGMFFYAPWPPITF